LRYPPDTAGGLMQTEYAAVLEGATVEEAVEIVRTLAEAVSDIHNVFVVDYRFHLLGVLPLSRLILARANETVDAVMDRQVISVTVNTDQEEVAQLFRKYDLLSLPVTDPRGALLGRITIDDVVDVLEEEASEDFAKLSGLGQEEPIFDSPMRAIRRRLPWLGLNLVTTSVSASVIGLFEGTIQTIAVAAALMTIVAAQGGNAGVQTLTVMVRGLALGQVTVVHARAILFKELAVACGNGVALGLVAGVAGYVLHRQALLAVVLGLALLVNYLVAALVASLIPLTLHWLRSDPAVASSVFVTACTDLCGFFSFLGLLTIGLKYFG
jgi:magnesium transporter